MLLAVGDVSYDEQSRQLTPTADRLVLRSAVTDGVQLHWKRLQATKAELTAKACQPRDREWNWSGRRQAPRGCWPVAGARWAHFATHGFFADKKYRSMLHMDERVSRNVPFSTRSAARWPAATRWSFPGWCWPANCRDKDLLGLPKGDGGILTAEAIAGLDLSKLELVVLSACETGLGDVAGGEGVFGLQRAFHLAGRRNVIASLWKVNDKATAALITVFYTKLWQDHKSPLDALRHAQLYIYRHPDEIGMLAHSRRVRHHRHHARAPGRQSCQDRLARTLGRFRALGRGQIMAVSGRQSVRCGPPPKKTTTRQDARTVVGQAFQPDNAGQSQAGKPDLLCILAGG